MSLKFNFAGYVAHSFVELYVLPIVNPRHACARVTVTRLALHLLVLLVM